jgi:hypothetical protein
MARAKGSVEVEEGLEVEGVEEEEEGVVEVVGGFFLIVGRAT